MAMLPLLALLAPLQGPVPQGTLPDIPARKVKPNVVIVIADDMGVDLIGTYAEGVNPPCTPTFDALAAEGLLFRNAWANPACSPTRAALFTGRYGFRTGIGDVAGGQTPGLDLAEIALPEAMPGYASSFLGKWHLAGSQGNNHPNDTGFGHFAGVIGGGVQNYYNWSKVTNGQTSNVGTYITTEITDDAIAEVLSLPEPFLCVVSYNAPHSPWQEPPMALCPGSTCAQSFCMNLPQNPSNTELAKAMVEAMDAEFGRLLQAIDARDPGTIVMFMGDNGSPGQVSETPFESGHAKGSVYEGGLNVPLIIRGAGVQAGESQAIVSTVDLYATAVDLAGFRSTAEDSVSLVPLFRNPRGSVRDLAYGERFNGNSPPYTGHRRALRGERYKLIRTGQNNEEFYDLQNDPFELNDLLPGLNAAQQAAYDAMDAEFAALGV